MWRCIAFTALSVFAGAHLAIAAPSLDIYVLAGQSNMSGRAPVAGLPPFKNAGHVFAWKDDGWVPAREPVAEESRAKVGPSLAFGDALYELRKNDVGLINCAVGGTSISQWAPSADPQTLYAACIKAARLASANGRIKGLIWYQGETDAPKIDAVKAWPNSFERLVASFRRDLNDPALPVVFTQIGPKDDSNPLSSRNLLISLQQKIHIPNAAMVSATDLTFQPGRLHLDQASQLKLGVMYANAMNGLERRVGKFARREK